MPSSVGNVISPSRRAALWLAAVALTSLALALLFAYASVPRSSDVIAGPAGDTTTVSSTVVRQRETSANGSGPAAGDANENPASLAQLLAPWALGADALALAGLAAVLAVRYGARRRGGART